MASSSAIRISSFPVAASQTRAEPSLLDVANRRPSALTVTRLTYPQWASRELPITCTSWEGGPSVPAAIRPSAGTSACSRASSGVDERTSPARPAGPNPGVEQNSQRSVSVCVRHMTRCPTNQQFSQLDFVSDEVLERLTPADQFV